MKSKTSFFNAQLLRKDVVRFAPAWVLFLVYLLLQHVSVQDPSSAVWYLKQTIPTHGIVNLGYAMVCAQLLFGDLFNTRMCNALHALPVRRESWFLTHVVAGIGFSVVPVMVAGMFQIFSLGGYWLAALLWAAALILEYLFFFAVAVFSMMLVGNRFAAVVVYSILNFLAGIVLWLFYSLYLNHLHGVAVDMESWLILCPVVWFFNFQWFNPVLAGQYLRVMDGWGYLAICAAIALVLLGGALLLYRKRALEKAGDFMVFRPLQPVFLVLYTFSAGAALHLFSNLFMGMKVEYVFLFIGLAVGFFTGLMLLARTIRVFRIRAFVQFGVLLATFGLTLVLTIIDPLGITRWVPKEESVKAVSVNYMAYGENDKAMTDPAVIRQVISIHQHGIDHPEEESNGLRDANVTLVYHMKDGRTVQRRYCIDSGTVAYITLEHVLSRPEQVFGSKYASVEALLENVVMIERTDDVTEGEREATTDKDKMRLILEALMKDCEEGTLCQEYPFAGNKGQQYGLRLEGQYNGNYRETWYVQYTKTSKNTYAAVNQVFP